LDRTFRLRLPARASIARWRSVRVSNGQIFIVLERKNDVFLIGIGIFLLYFSGSGRAGSEVAVRYNGAVAPPSARCIN
jgi:hypothetical protein